MLIVDSGDFFLVEHLFELSIKVGHGKERFKNNLNYLALKAVKVINALSNEILFYYINFKFIKIFNSFMKL